MRTRRPRLALATRSAFAGFRFPPDVIVLAVRWYLRFSLSYRDVEELLAERGIDVDHVTIYRWVQRFTPLLAEAARPCRHAVGNRWQVDETNVKVAGNGATSTARSTVRARHRCVRLPASRRDRSPSVLPTRHRRDQGDACGGRHRQGGGLPGRAGGGAPGRVASHGAVRQQPHRMRSRPLEGVAATDARTQAGPQRQGGRRRPCAGAEHAPWPR